MARKLLKREIAASQRRCWDALRDEVDKDVWGDGYKLVSKRLKAREPPQILQKESLNRTLATLFPRKREINWIPQQKQVEVIPPFTAEELKAAVERIKEKRAPGPDGIPPEIVKAAATEKPEVILQVMNRLLQNGEFPREWKKARLVLIRKPNKQAEDPAAFRPLCLLDAQGKLLEQLLRRRLYAHLEENGGLDDNQFGFRPGRSTIDALKKVLGIARKAKTGTHRTKRMCALITFDVRNAFNTASWRRIVKELRDRNTAPYLMEVVQSYLSERSILAESEEGTEEVTVTCGVPQGSVLGPLLWNVLYDGVLRLAVPDGVTLVAYADDLALIVVAKNTTELQESANLTISRICAWMTEAGLEMAPEKTEAVILAGRRRCQNVDFRIKDQTIVPGKKLKYLGVILDSGITFGEHLKKAASRASAVNAALSRLMPNIGGPRASKRRLYGHVVHSVMLYAAPIWSDALEKETHRKKLARIQRQTALRVCSAYRTVSEEAVLVVAGMPPIDLVAKSRTAEQPTGAPITRAERDNNLHDEWQERWTRGSKGAWTRRLIPRLRPWLRRNHGEASFHLTQLLTGHGCFQAYLARIRRVDSDTCPHCEAGTDDAEHTLFFCPAWEEERVAMMTAVGNATAENIVEKMLAQEGSWKAVEHYAQTVMRKKEKAEHQREASASQADPHS